MQHGLGEIALKKFSPFPSPFVMKDKETKEAFTQFCKDHPELRFWQSIYAFTQAQEIKVDGLDPFYRNGK